MKVYSGTKMYRYPEGSEHPEIIRILNIDYDTKQVKYLTESGEKKKGPYDKISRDYKILTPDGIISFAVVSMPDGDKDVITALHPFPKTEKGWEDLKGAPYAICRQLAGDIFSNIVDVENIIIGVSVSKDTCPPNVDYTCMLACTGVIYSRMVTVYLDDTLDDILGLFNNKIFDDVFTELEPKYKYVQGFCHSLRELLENNHFMFDLRKCFKVMEIPFAITEEEIKEEKLAYMNADFLASELKVNLKDTYLVKYSREIDFSKIRRDYVLATSAAEQYKNVYLIGFDKIK